MTPEQGEDISRTIDDFVRNLKQYAKLHANDLYVVERIDYLIQQCRETAGLINETAEG